MPLDNLPAGTGNDSFTMIQVAQMALQMTFCHVGLNRALVQIFYIEFSKIVKLDVWT